jgi:uncharacterized membrane protein
MVDRGDAMIIWGAIWGAILGVLLPRNSDEWTLILGGILGALAGWTLRKSVRNEYTRLAKQAGEKAAKSAVSTATATTVGAQPNQAASTAAITTAHPADATSPIGTPSIPVIAPSATGLPEANLTPTLATSAATVEAASAIAANTPATPVARAPAAPLPPVRRPKPDAVEIFMERVRGWLFGGNTVARVGAIVLFIGLSFLAKWAADNALFPPELRLAAIGVVGIALLVQGFRLSRRELSSTDAGDDSTNGTVRGNYGYLLQGAGVAVLYLTIFAAFKLYAMIPALAAFALMAIVCALSTLLALLADKQLLAFVGFAGAFATPILVSTGSGNHVALFSYYLLLNIAIGIVAWLRAWRALNLLGFFATFGVATLWGALKYAPENYASTQPFLIAFFAIYVLIGLFYALRHTQDGKRALDGILIFGTPIVSFMLQTQLVESIQYGAAISAVVASAVYLALALFARSRTGAVAQWLTMSYAALALVFATLAVPLAVDGRMTAAIWAIEGAGVFWLSLRQNKWLGQVFGAAMQIIAALAFVAAYDHVHDEAIRMLFVNSHFVGCVMLAIGNLLVSWWAFKGSTAQAANASDNAGNKSEKSTATSLQLTLLQACNIGFFLTGFVWLLVGLWSEINSPALALRSYAAFGWMTISALLVTLAGFLAWRRTGWTAARYPVTVVLPFLLLGAIVNLFSDGKLAPFWFNFALWPVAIAIHLFMLRGVDALMPRRWWRVVHGGNVLLLILVVAAVLDRAITVGQLRNTDWAAGILLTACTLLLLALCSARVWQPSPAGWPLDRFQKEYALYAGAGVAGLTLFGALLVACTARGNAAPLPYIPLLNPVDLIVALAIAAVALWLKRVRASTLVPASAPLRGAIPVGVVAFAAFIGVNTVWLRFAHHFRNIAWNADALAGSFFVQAGYSVLWTLLGVGAMWIAHRRGLRVIWQAGAALLGVTVVKLLLVDLANSGGGERIVAFIGVGIMMVAVGYFAPLPPAPGKAKNAEATHA